LKIANLRRYSIGLPIFIIENNSQKIRQVILHLSRRGIVIQDLLVRHFHGYRTMGQTLMSRLDLCRDSKSQHQWTGDRH
jgi:hypothetical protein